MFNFQEIANDPQSAATIIAAFLGALFATFGIWAVNRIENWLKRDHAKQQRDSVVMENFHSGLSAVEENTTHLLTTVTKNLVLLDDIKSSSENGKFFINSLETLPILKNVTGTLVNLKLVNKWTNVVLNANIDNGLINEFNSKYNELYTEVHKIYLNNGKPDLDVVQEDFRQIIDFADDLIAALVMIRSRAIELLSVAKALIRLNEYGYKPVRSPDSLRSFMPEPEHLNSVIGEQELIYQSGMFSSQHKG